MNSLPDAWICQEDIRLLEEYAVAAEAYFDAVRDLEQAKTEVTSFHAYALTELARQQCAASREAVERHREEHGCRLRSISAKA